jgi:glutamine cyclotransferase
MRFWKGVALLVVACIVYIMYSNVVGLQPKVSGKQRQHADSSPKDQASSETSQNLKQNVQHEGEPSRKQHPNPQRVASSQYPEKLKAVVLKAIPHDTGAFTQVLRIPAQASFHHQLSLLQGLFYDDETGDHFIECTGMWGQSSIRRLRVADGVVVQSRPVSDSSWFGEGCFRARAGVGVMMTWRNQVAFEFNTTTFEEIRRFPWPREGWGISGDGGSQVFATDGSSTLFSLHPSTYADVSSTSVKIAAQSGSQTVSRLNELELVDGQVRVHLDFSDC